MAESFLVVAQQIAIAAVLVSSSQQTDGIKHWCRRFTNIFWIRTAIEAASKQASKRTSERMKQAHATNLRSSYYRHPATLLLDTTTGELNRIWIVVYVSNHSLLRSAVCGWIKFLVRVELSSAFVPIFLPCKTPVRVSRCVCVSECFQHLATNIFVFRCHIVCSSYATVRSMFYFIFGFFSFAAVLHRIRTYAMDCMSFKMRARNRESTPYHRTHSSTREHCIGS